MIINLVENVFRRFWDAYRILRKGNDFEFFLEGMRERRKREKRKVMRRVGGEGIRGMCDREEVCNLMNNGE